MKARLVVLSALLGLSAAPALAADDATSGAIKYRQALMTLVGANFKPMGAMLKGELPYDQEGFARHAADLGAVASLDILRGFPEDSEGDGSDAKGEIWLSWDDFTEKMQQFQSEAAKLAEVAAGGDRDAIKGQFGATGKTCKACHDDYKK
jgi:cytochrome c556